MRINFNLNKRLYLTVRSLSVYMTHQELKSVHDAQQNVLRTRCEHASTEKSLAVYDMRAEK